MAETAYALPLLLTVMAVGSWAVLLYAACRLEMGRENAVSVVIVMVSSNIVVMAIWVWIPL